MKKIYLSPSNQVNNIYAYGNTNEMVECNKISEFAKNALLRCKFDVKKAPQGQSINENIKESNSWKSNLHIPIHTNAYNGAVTGGTLVMIYSMSKENEKAGKAILNAVSPISPGPDYSLKINPNLAELNKTNAIAVYLEIEMHDTRHGAEWIINNTKSIGEAICKGVCNYYETPYEPENNSNSKLYKVQIGTFKEKSNAEKCLQDAKKCGFDDAFILF
ncbi:MAG: N-acetylmuramoyl-L-alanine amidase [Firmicutes bacterium]|nr:N-acetylmuramoyl-L-alanine amidase [Bacillota bacterium]